MGCRSRCGGPLQNGFHWDALLKASLYWSERGWPGASRTCEQLRQIVRRTRSEDPFPDEAAINECSEWELNNGTQPWDEHRFCQSMPPGNDWHYTPGEYWYVTKSSVPVSVGTQSAPIYLKISPESSAITARFIFDGITEPSSTRNFVQFLKLETHQAN